MKNVIFGIGIGLAINLAFITTWQVAERHAQKEIAAEKAKAADVEWQAGDCVEEVDKHRERWEEKTPARLFQIIEVGKFEYRVEIRENNQWAMPYSKSKWLLKKFFKVECPK